MRNFRFFDEVAKRYGLEAPHKSLSARDRAKLCEEILKNFQETKDPRVLIIQPQAAAHGVTLTAANVVIWYAPVTSTETYLQANARINRPGQRNAMTIVHIEGSPIERKLYAMLQSNITNHEKVVDLYKKELADT